MIGWILLAIGTTAVIGLFIHHNMLKAEQEKVQATLAQHHAKHRASLGTDDAKDLAPRLQRAAEVIEQLAFPWNELFKALELSDNDDVVLLSIQPDIKAGTIYINAEARDWSAMLSYVRELSKDKFFSDAHLVSHHIDQTDPQKPIRFVLACAWIFDRK
jgi:Tfp pilus assembly protein PilN